MTKNRILNFCAMYEGTLNPIFAFEDNYNVKNQFIFPILHKTRFGYNRLHSPSVET